MAINKQSFLNKIKQGVNVAGSILSQGSRQSSAARSAVADQTATSMFMNKIPVGIPPEVRQKAKIALQEFTKAGNYKAARDYVAGLQPKPMIKRIEKEFKRLK